MNFQGYAHYNLQKQHENNTVRSQYAKVYNNNQSAINYLILRQKGECWSHMSGQTHVVHKVRVSLVEILLFGW